MRTIIFFSVFLSCAAAGFFPLQAQAGVIEFLFPSLREKEIDPAETMVAPFAQDGEVEKLEKLKALPNETALDKPHLNSVDIGQWVMTAVGESMNFDAGDPTKQIQARLVYFDTVGANQYEIFLREKNIVKVVESGRYNMRSYVELTPLLLNEGVISGSYRWLYQVPVVISYMDKSMRDYKNVEPITQRALLNVQIGRVSSPDKPMGLQIEQWSGKIAAFDKQ